MYPITHLILPLFYWFLMLFLLTSCGGGGSGEEEETETIVESATVEEYSAIFTGSTVFGVGYRASLDGMSVEGITNVDGKFNFFSKDGIVSPVTFFVGDITLGTVNSPPIEGDSPEITVFDLVDGSDDDAENKGVNLYRFLKSLDDTQDQQTIQISAAHHTQFSGVSNMTLAKLSEDDFENKLTPVLQQWGGLVSKESVVDHLQESKRRGDSHRIKDLILILGASKVLADGVTPVRIGVKLEDKDGKPVAGGRVVFQSTVGSFDVDDYVSKVVRLSDDSGEASVFLIAPKQSSKATLFVTAGGWSENRSLSFVSGSPHALNSTLTVNPSVLPADGESKAEVIVFLRDDNGNPVKDETVVSLISSMATVSPIQKKTISGQASFTLTAPSIVGFETLMLLEFPDVQSVAVTYLGAGVPGAKGASIGVEVNETQLTVQGSGKRENSIITLTVLDGLGNPLDETLAGYAANSNNLRLTFQTHPGGGEVLSGSARTSNAESGADVETVNSNQTLLLRTQGGKSVVNIQSGTLPGVIELKSELLDSDGETVLVSAVSPLIAISSGPPHTITLTRGYEKTLLNLNNYGMSGVYCKSGALLVTDQYGNGVPDDTVISLGLVDSVIHEGYASLTENSETLTLIEGAEGFSESFEQAFVKRTAGIERTIQEGDRILIPEGVSSADRSHFVKVRGDATLLGSDRPFLQDGTPSESVNPVHYYVGSSLLGGAIHGYPLSTTEGWCDPEQLTTGVTKTTGGLAPVRVTYPANKQTLFNGCYGYDDVTGEYSSVDSRFDTPQSAQVLVVASANDGVATVVDKGSFCFSSAAPAKMTLVPNSLTGSGFFKITLEDAHNTPLPFVSILCTVSVVKNISNTMDISVDPVFGRTNSDGIAYVDVTVNAGGGGVEADEAQVVCQALDVETSVALTVQ